MPSPSKRKNKKKKLKHNFAQAFLSFPNILKQNYYPNLLQFSLKIYNTLSILNPANIPTVRTLSTLPIIFHVLPIHSITIPLLQPSSTLTLPTNFPTSLIQSQNLQPQTLCSPRQENRIETALAWSFKSMRWPYTKDKTRRTQGEAMCAPRRRMCSGL